MKTFRLILRFVLFVSLLITVSPQNVSAADCSIQSFNMTPNGQVSLGTHVYLEGRSNCGTVKFTVNGQSKAEIGQPNQTETLKTEEFGTGSLEVCFLGRGSGGWENAAKNCQTLYVQGSQGNPGGGSITGRCWVNQLTVSPGTAQIGSAIQLAGSGQCDGNARASRFYIDGSPFGEFGGNTTSASWGTASYSAGSHKICFGITSGDWSAEEKSCTYVNLTSAPQQANPPSQGAPSQPTPQPTSTQEVLIPTQESGSDTSESESRLSNGSSSTCLTHQQLFNIGDQGKVTPGTPNRLRSCAGADCKQIGNIPGNGGFSVLDGPVCKNGYWWWKVDYDGKIGWTAEGDKNSYWLIKDISSSSPASKPADNVSVNVYSDYWQDNYSLSVNPRTCAITNGAEIIAQEIKHFDNKIGQLATDNLRISEWLSYFKVNDGQTEKFRNSVESAVKKETGCYYTYYLVGKATMDTSGLGNVAFGYGLQKWPAFGEFIASATQGLNKESRGWFYDNPDDRTQRELGEKITKLGLIDPRLIAQTAEEINLY